MSTYLPPTPVLNDPYEGQKPDFYKRTPRGEDVIYIDLDMNLETHPMTGDFALVRNGKAVMQSIRNLVMTSAGEILMNSEIGGGVPDNMFNAIDSLTVFNLSSQIKRTIANHEPRAEVTDLSVWRAPDNDHAIIISVKFFMRGSTIEYDEQITLERTR
ncbi:gp25 base plate wedge subunit [Delftia phage PhiW-14]|uniref:Gp25 base plate wedge subunit n=1 Tax=Delftia phage PhiW-14 TaxID=665032 RepID=C9DG54_BPW14|nr:gp25 base plate wedge subunit [Delftia phage PhiW-14]ACV50105.1 gp25 base plate wedge subunit [Delftia phage PhiW-14]